MVHSTYSSRRSEENSDSDRREVDIPDKMRFVELFGIKIVNLECKATQRYWIDNYKGDILINRKGKLVSHLSPKLEVEEQK